MEEDDEVHHRTGGDGGSPASISRAGRRVTGAGAPRGLRLGASWTPSRDWFHPWHDLDLDEVRRDFDSLAALGLDHVRVLPLREVLQPDRTRIRERAVADVVAVVDAAAEAGLDASVDVLQRHLSSYDVVPSWLLSWHRRALFTDPQVVDAQAALVGALGTALGDRAGFLGLTLGNETNQFATTGHPDRQDLTPDDAQRWLTRLLAAAGDAAPGRAHTHSSDDDVWFGDASAVTPGHAVRLGDLTTVHSWVFTGVAAHFAPGHPAFTWFARYLLELAAAWGDPGRPVWLQEVGAPEPHVGAGRVVRFASDTLRHAAAHPGLWGVTWWCSHDVDRSPADFPELEHTLGLLGSDRSVKPLGAAVRYLAPELREIAAAAAAGAGPEPDVWPLPVEDDGRVRRSRTAPGSTFFAEWVAAAAAGSPPQLRLPDGADAGSALVEEGAPAAGTVLPGGTES